MRSPRPDVGFQAFRQVDFNWAIRLQDVWRDVPGDVPELHRGARIEILDELERLKETPDDASPLGRFVLGEAGAGKTHLLASIRRETARRGLGFILVDMTDVRDFWETVAQGYLNSLQANYLDGRPQYALLLEKLLQYVKLRDGLAMADALGHLRRHGADGLQRQIKKALDHLVKTFPQPTQLHQDAIRALMCLNSRDFGIANTGMTWLQGLEIDDDLRRTLHFQHGRQEPRQIVRALSWIVSLAGPSVLAFDQLDPIVHQVSRQDGQGDVEEENAARLIIDRIGNGLAALRETTTRTLAVVSCLEASYRVLQNHILQSSLDRFHPPTRLQYHRGSTLNQLLIARRLAPVYQTHAFTPPYATWPFTVEAIAGLRGLSPREVLRHCERHRRRCIEAGRVDELRSFEITPAPSETPARDRLEALDRQFAEAMRDADLAPLHDEKHEDDALAPLYQLALQCLIYENDADLPEDVHVEIATDFGGGKTTAPLHARLTFRFLNQGDREEHYCLRVLLKKHHAAYRARLKAAITQSGIDPRLPFRRLTVIRSADSPSGDATQQITAKFRELGGRFHAPSEMELRTLAGLARLAEARDPDWRAWLAQRRPVTRLGLGRTLAPGSLFDKPDVLPTDAGTRDPAPAPRIDPPLSPSPPSPPRPADAPRLLLGHRVIGDTASAPMFVRADLLEKHTFVVAGAGSGKTNLLKHLIEEAARHGIPSIVIDSANDLVTLGQPRPDAELTPESRENADTYFRHAEVVIWTPGVERGNPLQLNPLPDFSAVRDDPEALAESVLVAVDALTELVATGTPAVIEKKIGILHRVLEYFARQDLGTLDALIALLQEPPQEALLNIDKAGKLARDMADMLIVRRENNPLLRSSGTKLDPAALFGDHAPSGKTRVSVINLSGLGGDANKQQFVNQLAMTLFDWSKKHPDPPGRWLRGLFIVDEAKDFVPSRTGSVCKRSVLRCAAQLRKYHVGMLFATQSPKDLDNTIVQNCSTHFYGKVSSSAAIDTVRELMKSKGGTGQEIGSLPAGTFYVHNADSEFKTPTKIRVPLCVSHHRTNAPSPDEVIALAQQFR